MSVAGNTIPVAELQARSKVKQPNAWIRNKNGDIIGSGFKMPKGDFGHFLGWKPESRAERSGEKKVSGARALEIAIHKQINELGNSAVKNGDMYRNMYISWGKFSNEPGREKDMLQSGMDAIKESVELGHSMGMRYLEMQYKFQLAFKNFGSISNLMKTRHEAVKKSISEVR